MSILWLMRLIGCWGGVAMHQGWDLRRVTRVSGRVVVDLRQQAWPNFQAAGLSETWLKLAPNGEPKTAVPRSGSAQGAAQPRLRVKQRPLKVEALTGAAEKKSYVRLSR